MCTTNNPMPPPSIQYCYITTTLGFEEFQGGFKNWSPKLFITNNSFLFKKNTFDTFFIKNIFLRIYFEKGFFYNKFKWFVSSYGVAWEKLENIWNILKAFVLYINAQHFHWE